MPWELSGVGKAHGSPMKGTWRNPGDIQGLV